MLVGNYGINDVLNDRPSIRGFADLQSTKHVVERLIAFSVACIGLFDQRFLLVFCWVQTFFLGLLLNDFHIDQLVERVEFKRIEGSGTRDSTGIEEGSEQRITQDIPFVRTFADVPVALIY